ncbi:MAG: RNA polymerase subunit sigma-24 [Verrucomicrobia bacterium]|nr:MAG: RNA polymerase subunit sigma-24 [Verrucomicrobiota bacterium]
MVRAAQTSSPQAHEALAKLCCVYWYPLYAYVRRQGYSAHDAQDLTQDFFARFLQKNFLAQVHADKGKLRSFLLAALKHFLANEWDKATAQKRGGRQTFVPIDHHTAETRYGLEPADPLSADKIFERRWALALLEHVLANLREEYSTAGKADLFEALKSSLTGERSAIGYAQLAPKLGMTEGAVKVAVHRLRQRYRESLRAEIAHTVDTPDQVEEELRYLFTALS